MSTVAAAPVHAIEEIPGAVGYIAPGISIEVVDQSGKVLPPEQEGLLRMRSRCGVSCYLGDAAASVFRDGWFCPGDMGSITQDNVLTISSREKQSTNAQSA